MAVRVGHQPGRGSQRPVGGEGQGTATFKILNKGNLPLGLKKVAVAPDAYGFLAMDPGPQTIQPGGSDVRCC